MNDRFMRTSTPKEIKEWRKNKMSNKEIERPRTDKAIEKWENILTEDLTQEINNYSRNVVKEMFNDFKSQISELKALTEGLHIQNQKAFKSLNDARELLYTHDRWRYEWDHEPYNNSDLYNKTKELLKRK